MKALSESIEKLKKSSSQINYDTELSKIVQNFTSEMEACVGDECTYQMTEEHKTEIAYFVNIVNAISSNDAFLRDVSLEKISSTLNAATIKGCKTCPEPPCKAEKSIGKMNDLFIERLQFLRKGRSEI
ncbi:hypothetical protein QT973_18500 [Microcoleus sp. Z1_A1]|uniref:hypothetical protein n=1 Tax=Microcoleus sp. Z1_A1 TaxID=3055428 RepID=UPI002FD47711